MALASSSTFSEGAVRPPSESEELQLPEYVTIIIMLNGKMGHKRVRKKHTCKVILCRTI